MSTPPSPTVTPTAAPYPLAMRHLGRGRLDLLDGDVRLMLATSAYTPAPGDEWAATVAAHETSGPGYTPGGFDLPHQSYDYDTTAGKAVLTCDPIVVADAGFTFRYGIAYQATGDPATSPLLSLLDFGADVDPDGTDLTLAFPAGLLRIYRPAAP